MNLTALKLAALNALLRWIAGHLWELAQDAVSLLGDRDDLSGPEKLALARTILLDWAKDARQELTTSAAHFLLEAAVQMVKAQSAQRTRDEFQP